MIQWDGSEELKAILDGVFKPPHREERRARQRFTKTSVMRQPVLIGYNSGSEGHPAVLGEKLETSVKQTPIQTQVASTEDLIREGYHGDRVINSPPPTPTEDAASDVFGLGYVSPASRIWPGDR